MASIYDKALKRKDFSGTVRKDATGKDAEKSNDPKSSADVGKVVNMMSGDANQIAFLVSGMYFIYGAPFEIALAGIYLYKLLGWSAFSGLVVLAVFWPLNQYVAFSQRALHKLTPCRLLARRSISISKGLLAARDKRMGVLNELLGAIKFIKFFAWEDRWTQRTMDARKKELSWMVKSRINSVLFSAIWTLAPILVSVVSFASYIWVGNQLTVSVAFTAISLFAMVRAPLNVIPTWIVFMMQTKVALDRIQGYIDDDEVDGQVSSLKEDTEGRGNKEGLGIVKGSFKWNEVEEKDEKGKGKVTEAVELDAGSDTASIPPEVVQEHIFELRDISVIFPDGQLTVVTGTICFSCTFFVTFLLIYSRSYG
jgi:ABC-type multidrug transport system fused ATPase/permease subunit